MNTSFLTLAADLAAPSRPLPCSVASAVLPSSVSRFLAGAVARRVRFAGDAARAATFPGFPSR